MSYENTLSDLTERILSLDYVQDFRQIEAEFLSNAEIHADYEQMITLQKNAVLYQKIGKNQAFKESSQAAQKLEKALKNNLLVEEYRTKMEAVSSLLEHLTGQIENEINDKLGRI